jgi:hypothetical protein
MTQQLPYRDHPTGSTLYKGAGIEAFRLGGADAANDRLPAHSCSPGTSERITV